MKESGIIFINLYGLALASAIRICPICAFNNDPAFHVESGGKQEEDGFAESVLIITDAVGVISTADVI